MLTSAINDQDSRPFDVALDHELAEWLAEWLVEWVKGSGRILMSLDLRFTVAVALLESVLVQGVTARSNETGKPWTKRAA
jgi:hypothetical protein